MKLNRPRLTFILFLILSILYFAAMHTQGYLGTSPLEIFARGVGPVIALYILAEAISRKCFVRGKDRADSSVSRG